jgi:DNA-binding transcriptional regulator GbsR (MarR family)
MATNKPVFDAFVDRMGITAETDGMSPIAGRLFARLVLADAPLSLDELAEELGVSKASVSTDARRLLERGILERVSKPGDRRDYYELAQDFFPRIVHARINRWRRMRTLAANLRAEASDLPAAVQLRLDAIDDIEQFVIQPLENALDNWTAMRQQAASIATEPNKSTTR